MCLEENGCLMFRSRIYMERKEQKIRGEEHNRLEHNCSGRLGKLVWDERGLGI